MDGQDKDATGDSQTTNNRDRSVTPVTPSGARYLRFLAGEPVAEPGDDQGEPVEERIPQPAEPDPEPAEVLIPGPDPRRPFWWFSTRRVSKDVPAGMAVPAPPGARIPADADYWAHPGDPDWTPVPRPGP